MYIIYIIIALSSNFFSQHSIYLVSAINEGTHRQGNTEKD